MKAIGKAFVNELKAAGLFGLPFSWGDDGLITFAKTMTPEQISAVNGVYATHDPDTVSPEEIVAAKDAQDIAAANAYGKLTALKHMTPAEIQAWVGTNVTNLAQAQDAIATLAIGVGILARRL